LFIIIMVEYLRKEINDYLKKNQNKSAIEKLKKIINLRINTPYKNFPFKNEKEGEIPFFPLAYSDCTSFVLTSIALALSNNIQEAKQNIIKIHYKENKVNYENRFHFTEERIIKSKYFKNITNRIFKVYDEISLVLNKRDNGSRLIDINFKKRVKIFYVSKFEFLKNKNLINEGLVNIAFGKLRNIKNGHFISHEGFLLENKYLIHSSKEQGKVVKIDIEKYLEEKEFDGIIIIKLNLDID